MAVFENGALSSVETRGTRDTAETEAPRFREGLLEKGGGGSKASSDDPTW